MSSSATKEDGISILSLSFHALITIFIYGMRDNVRTMNNQMTTLLDDKNISASLRRKESEKLEHIINDMMNMVDAIRVLQDKHNFTLQNYQTMNKQSKSSKPISNMKHKLECLTFGYINQTIER
eukprot:14559_1